MSEPINCPSCNAPVDLPATACPYCGAALASDSRNTPTLISAAPEPLFSSSAAAMDEIKRLLRASRKVEAVKVHREYFGTSLKASKEAVDAIESDLRFQAGPPRAAVSSAEEPVEPGSAFTPAEPVMSANPFDAPQKPPAWRNWAIGCSLAFVLFCCLCLVLPAILYSVMSAQGGG
ncbi:MAG: hypothetical protein RBS68_07310 [Anaerolineales bacterium]|jgi:hypothetical protein|nr:hypothetical protein [Anaerolineales bacterium]